MMTDDRLAYLLSSWIPPGVIADAAQRLHDVPDDILAEGRLLIMSRVLEHGNDAGLSGIVQQYLSKFYVPDELLDVAACFFSGHVRYVEAPLRATKYSGTVIFKAETTADKPGLTEIIELTAPQLELRLVQWPVVMLADTVASLALYWRRVVAKVRNVHHEPMTEELLSWIDIRVARYYGLGFVGRAGILSNRGYVSDQGAKEFSAHGPLPIDPFHLFALKTAWSRYPKTTVPTGVEFFHDE